MIQGKRFAEWLKRTRAGRGWSRAELARRARMNPATVGQIESSRLVPYRSQVEKLEAALRGRGAQTAAGAVR